jgi:hypothetical protein
LAGLGGASQGKVISIFRSSGRCQAWLGKARPGKARQGKVISIFRVLGTARQGQAWQGRAWLGNARFIFIFKSLQFTRKSMNIKITIEGTTPLICNNFTDAAKMAATNGTRAAVIGSKGSPREQAEAKLYVGASGKPMIPQPNLFRCIIDGGSFFKAGKSKVTTLKSSMIPSCVDVEGVEIPIISKDGWDVDTRAVRIPSTGGRILCHRPSFHDWALKFSLELDNEMMTDSLLREIVDAAGKRVGLGDFRPACKGPFGKFVVTSWKAK